MPELPLVRCRAARPIALAALLSLLAGGVAEAWECEPEVRSHLRRRPRHARRAPRIDREHFVDLKLGTFDPNGNPARGAFFGLSTGIEVERRLALGFNLDFYRRSFTEEVVIAERVDPNGHVVTTVARRLHTASNLLPLGASLALRLPGSGTVTPYAGAGVAYEILVNHYENFEEGVEETQVFAGPGWQAFGGLIVPVASGVRFLGELWYNEATVRRNVDHYERGLPVSERIEVDGLGARLGIELAFP